MKAYILGGANIPVEKDFFSGLGFNFPFLNFTNINFVEVFNGEQFSIVSSQVLPNQPGGIMVRNLEIQSPEFPDTRQSLPNPIIKEDHHNNFCYIVS